MCALTGRKREVAWFQVLVALLLWEIGRADLYDERFLDERRARHVRAAGVRSVQSEFDGSEGTPVGLL